MLTLPACQPRIYIKTTSGSLPLPSDLQYCTSTTLISQPIHSHPQFKMRTSSILLSIASLMAITVLANPTVSPAQGDDITKRGCGTGNWCCTVASPSSYCVKYCAGGSKYINCSASSVSYFRAGLRVYSFQFKVLPVYGIMKLTSLRSIGSALEMDSVFVTATTRPTRGFHTMV